MTDAGINVTIEEYTGTAEPFNPDSAQSFDFALQAKDATPADEETLNSSSASFYPAIPSNLPSVPAPPQKALILNIETTGFSPYDDQLIAIAYQDAQELNTQPTVVMGEDELALLQHLFDVIKTQGYTLLIGYGFGFELFWITNKAMKYGITCKEFADADVYDVMQSVTQLKQSFVYKPQSNPSLSDVAGYLFNFPKPFTDADMIRYWMEGKHELVYQFASEQITRTLLVYLLFRHVTENSYSPLSSGVLSSAAVQVPSNPLDDNSALTIPEANAPKTWRAKCPVDLSEWDVPITQNEFVCPIDGTVIKR